MLQLDPAMSTGYLDSLNMSTRQFKVLRDLATTWLKDFTKIREGIHERQVHETKIVPEELLENFYRLFCALPLNNFSGGCLHEDLPCMILYFIVTFIV